MKKYFILLFSFFFTLCSASENPKLKEYKDYLLSLNQAKYYSTSMAVSKYKELFAIENLTVRDEAFVMFDNFYKEVRSKINESHLDDEIDYTVLFNDYNTPSNTKVSNLIIKYRKDLNENGFDIAISEGLTYIKSERNFISRNFYSFISPAMKEYCTFYNIISKEETVDDGALAVYPRRLAERVLWLEKYIESNPNFKLIEDCKMFYRYFLYLLLSGTENTPLLEDNSDINARFVDAFEFITLEYSNSTTAKYVLPVYISLKNKQKKEAYILVEKYITDKIIER